MHLYISMDPAPHLHSIPLRHYYSHDVKCDPLPRQQTFLFVLCREIWNYTLYFACSITTSIWRWVTWHKVNIPLSSWHCPAKKTWSLEPVSQIQHIMMLGKLSHETLLEYHDSRLETQGSTGEQTKSKSIMWDPLLNGEWQHLLEAIEREENGKQREIGAEMSGGLMISLASTFAL